MSARSIGTVTVLAVMVGYGGYLAHSSFSAAAAQPAPVPASRVTAAAPSPSPVRLLVARAPQSAGAGAKHTTSEKRSKHHDRRNERDHSRTRSDRRGTGDRQDLRVRKQPRSNQSAAGTATVWLQQNASGRSTRKLVQVRIASDHRADTGGNRQQIVAMNGAIVYIGDDGRLVANTGDTASSGIVALAVDGSDFTSGTSHGNDSFTSLTSGANGSSTSVSGFEDHSVSVIGDNQLVTYDDSNVFVNRDGSINANTGDTDSSGLNATDVTDSTIRSGNSGDGEEADEQTDDEQTDDEQTDDEQTDDEQTDGEQPAQSAGTPRKGGKQVSGSAAAPRASVTDEGASTASGERPLVVGADGFDDVSIRSRGNGNLISYDDSNVIIGGSGHVNAQVGDSDTGGTVVMGVHGSDITAGCEGDLCSAK